MKNTVIRLLILSLLSSFNLFANGSSQTNESTDPIAIEFEKYKKEIDDLLLISMEYDSVITLVEEGIVHFGDDEEKVMKLKRYKGIAFDIMNQEDSCLHYYDQVLNFSTKTKNILLEGALYNDYGIFYFVRNKLDSAAYYYLKGIKVGELNNDYFSLGVTYNNLGLIKQRQKSYAAAEEYYNESIAMYSKIEQTEVIKRKIISAYINLASCAELAGLLEKADAYCDIALERSTKINDTLSAVNIIISKGLIAYKNEEPRKSITYTLLGYNYMHTPDVNHTIPALYNLGAAYNALGLYDSAIYYSKIGLNYGLELESQRFIKGFHQSLYESYELKQDYKKAYEHLTAYVDQTDENTSIEEFKIVEEMERKYAAEKKGQALLLLQQRSEIQRLYILLLTISILLALVLFYFIYRRRKVKYELNLALHRTKISQAALLGQEDERKRISLELHDSIGATLANISIRMDTIREKQVQPIDGLANLKSDIDFACAEIRTISHNLAPYKIEQEGLIFAIDDLIINLNRGKQTEFKSSIYIDENQISILSKSIIYRIIQELTTNIYKHAKASFATINIEKIAENLIIQVQDNGIGYNEKKVSKGIGLKNIHTRIAYLNGMLDIVTEKDYGALFMVSLPYNSLLTKA